MTITVGYSLGWEIAYTTDISDTASPIKSGVVKIDLARWCGHASTFHVSV